LWEEWEGWEGWELHGQRCGTSETGGRQDGRTWETATTKKINKCVR
jgi:hypothetical protein